MTLNCRWSQNIFYINIKYILYKYKIYFILVLWSLVVVVNSIFKVTALCSPSGANHGSKLTTSASADGSVCIEVHYNYHATCKRN